MLRHAETGGELRRTAAHAVLGRFGLGHSLLAWARAYLWARDHAVPMLAPRWRYLRIGPYLRRESDKRRYETLFRYDGYVRGARKAAWLLAARSVPIEEIGDGVPPAGRRPRVIVFRNDLRNNTRYFRELLGRHDELRQELLRVTRPEHRPPLAGRPFIGMHVRRGDFNEVSLEMLRAGEGNARLPVTWFVEMLRGLRRGFGRDLPAVVFTDGTPEEVSGLLAERAVSLAPRRSAIHDLLSMSQAAVIAGSASGMTMWGSFLGQVPRISFPGQRKERLITVDSSVELEPEWEHAADVTDDFCRYVAGRTAP